MANPQNYASNAINQGYATTTETAAPRTITSAISRMETLNERLGGVRVGMQKLADQIGGPAPDQREGIAQRAPGHRCGGPAE